MKNERVAVVSVHPDDETIGCGGSLLRYKEKGYEIHWVIVTDIAEKYGWNTERIQSRTIEIEKVNQMYGFNSVHNLKYKPAGLDEYPQSKLISSFSTVFSKIAPSIVILPNPTDIHSDHAVAFTAAYSCTKKFRYPSINQIMTMEVLSETDFGYPLNFKANFFVDISSTFRKKIEIMEIFESELGEHPFPRSKRSLEALAILRGTQAGVEYAEAFHLIKQII